MGHKEMSDMAEKSKVGHVVVKNVTKVYDPYGVNVHAVDNCSFEIKPGDFMAMVGPSGCGKTTMLNMIAGFDTVTEGEIILDGELIASNKKKLMPGPDRMVVFQLGALFPWRTVIDNVCFGPQVQGKYTNEKKELKEKAMAFLRVAGLEECANDYPMSISSGMQRRVEIVRALMTDPKILLLDEPFRALDAMTKSVIQRHLLELYDLTGKTIMLITHDLREAIFLASKIFVMTTRPGTLKKRIDVDIPRPRSTDVMTSNEFLGYMQELLDAVHEEAVKAFVRGERELAR
ncbi:MAG: Taurine import ATP-binding protein TauB [Syntrophomonadaceae bacterium]|nr:Taurine import ATP-binding protein TauB [Bacillota bacterium]